MCIIYTRAPRIANEKGITWHARSVYISPIELVKMLLNYNRFL